MPHPLPLALFALAPPTHSVTLLTPAALRASTAISFFLWQASLRHLSRSPPNTYLTVIVWPGVGGAPAPRSPSPSPVHPRQLPACAHTAGAAVPEASCVQPSALFLPVPCVNNLLPAGRSGAASCGGSVKGGDQADPGILGSIHTAKMTTTTTTEWSEVLRPSGASGAKGPASAVPCAALCNRTHAALDAPVNAAEQGRACSLRTLAPPHSAPAVQFVRLLFCDASGMRRCRWAPRQPCQGSAAPLAATDDRTARAFAGSSRAASWMRSHSTASASRGCRSGCPPGATAASTTPPARPWARCG